MSDDFVKSGTLTKQGNVRKSWKRRLFRLHRNGHLSYYKDPLKPALGSIDVKGQCIGLLRSHQCYCQWPTNVPRPTCFGVMTPTRVFHFYADSSDDVDDWISLLRNTSDILRRQSSLTVGDGQLYENLQGISGAQVNEEDSDGDEISYEDVVKDADESEDGIYTVLPATVSKTATATSVQSQPPLPARVSTSSDRLSLADEVFQLADELVDALAEDAAEEILYEVVPADQDVSAPLTGREHPKPGEVINPIFTADGVEGDTYDELDTDKGHELYEQEELYDDVAISSTDHESTVPVIETPIQEELYDDVAATAAIHQVAPVAAQDGIEAPSEVAVEHVAVDYKDNAMQHLDEMYDVVADDHREIVEELYDDVAHTEAVVMKTAKAVLDDKPKKDFIAGQQHQELYDAVESEQSVQEELYDEVSEVTEAARRHRESRNQTWVSPEDHEMKDSSLESREQVEEELLVSTEAEQLATFPEQTGRAVGEYYPDLATSVSMQDTGQDSVQDKQGAVLVSQVEKVTEPTISASTLSSMSAMAPSEAAIKSSQSPEHLTTQWPHEKTYPVSRNDHETLSNAQSNSLETSITQQTTESLVSSHVSSQAAGRKLISSGKHDQGVQHGHAAEKKQTSELMTMATVVRRAASTWSRSGSRLKEKDAKLRQSRHVEEEAARQIAEWKAVRSRLFQKRGEASAQKEMTVETTSQSGRATTRKDPEGTHSVKQNGGTDQPPSSYTRGKPTPPRKPTTIAAVAAQLRRKEQSQAASALSQTKGNQGKQINDKQQQQQRMERTFQQHMEGTQHVATKQSKKQTTAGKRKETASSLDGTSAKLRDSEIVAKSSSNTPNTVSSGSLKSSPPSKPQTSSGQVAQGSDAPAQSVTSSPHIDTKTSAAVTTERQVHLAKRPELPAKPSTLPSRSSRSGMAAAIGLAAEHQKQLKEWERKRREVFATQKMHQERQGAEEKRRREEQAEQFRQLQMLEAEKTRQARDKPARSKEVVGQRRGPSYTQTSAATSDKGALYRKNEVEGGSETQQLGNGQTEKKFQSGLKMSVHGDKHEEKQPSGEVGLHGIGLKMEGCSTDKRSAVQEEATGSSTSVVSSCQKRDSKISGTVACASAKVESSPASSSVFPSQKTGVLGVVRRFEGMQPPKKPQSPERVQVQVDESNKASGVNSSTEEKPGDQSFTQGVMSHGAEVEQSHTPDKTGVNSSSKIVMVPEKHEQDMPSLAAPIPYDKPPVTSASSQLERAGKLTAGKPDATLKEGGQDLEERKPRDTGSDGLKGAFRKADETEANTSRESAAANVLTNPRHAGTVGHVPLPLTKSSTNATFVVPTALPADTAVRDNGETIESSTSRAAESGTDGSTLSAHLGDSLKNPSRNDNTDRPKYEPHLSDVQIREKKGAAKRRAAALSWPMEKPPEDPLGAEGAGVGDENPLMMRKLSVVARGANAMVKALAAARWIDKEIRKLIAEIQNLGSLNINGKYEVTFGVLFEECSPIFEALSGTLKTAKKHGVVHFNSELLLQGVHTAVVVTLIKESIPDSNADTYTYQQFRACSISVHKRKGKAFGKTSQQMSQSKCFICGKTVYAMEYVSADDYPMHKSCFKCCDCGKKLAGSKYAALNDKFYCMNHYEQRFKQQGGYGGFK